MYTLVVRDNIGYGHRILYNPHTSEMIWHTGAKVDLPISYNNNIQLEKFSETLKNYKKIHEIDNYKSFKEECKTCPVVQLCRGSYPNSSCVEAYMYNVNLLCQFIKIATNMNLEQIEGYTTIT